MAKKKSANVQNSDIPSSFYKGGKGHFASNVGELKALLSLLPDDVALAYSEFGGLRISVSNNGEDAPSDPYVTFEELDDADEYEDQP